MKKFGKNFWLVFLPFHLCGILALFYVLDYYYIFLILWFLIGVVGNGVAGHRYFAHGQFETYEPVRWILGFFATLGAFGPITYWTVQHKMHHLRADTINDSHSPVYNNWFYVFYAWTFPQGSNQDDYLKDRYAKRLSVQLMRDPFYIFFHNNYYRIIFLFSVILAIINPAYFFMYSLAYCVDFFRLGAVNYWCHRSGYRNFETNDTSTNNIWVGWLGMGFGWHNNHHAHPGRLILTEKWWEIDLEGYIGKLISK